MSRQDSRLRLEMLAMRAELQRMELRQQVAEVKQSLAWGNLLVAGAKRLMQSRNWVQGSALAQHFVTQYPLVAMLGSTLFGLYRKPLMRLGGRMAIVGALGGAAWWYWKSHQVPQRAPVDVTPRADRTAAGAADTAGSVHAAIAVSGYPSPGAQTDPQPGH